MGRAVAESLFSSWPWFLRVAPRRSTEISLVSIVYPPRAPHHLGGFRVVTERSLVKDA